jgi:hypothetical protein
VTDDRLERSMKLPRPATHAQHASLRGSVAESD